MAGKDRNSLRNSHIDFFTPWSSFRFGGGQVFRNIGFILSSGRRGTLCAYGRRDFCAFIGKDFDGTALLKSHARSGG